VRKIEIYTCPAGQKQPLLLHRAVSSVSNIETLHDQSLLQYFDKSSSAGVSPSRDVFYRKLLTTPDHLLPLVSSNVRVNVESFTSCEFETHVDDVAAPVSTSSDLAAITTANAADKDGENHNDVAAVADLNNVDDSPEQQQQQLQLQQLARKRSIESMIAHRQHTHTLTRQCLSQQEESTYLIVSGLRGGEAKLMACDEANRHLKLVPMGAVAACVSKFISVPTPQRQKLLVVPDNIAGALVTSSTSAAYTAAPLFPMHYDHDNEENIYDAIVTASNANANATAEETNLNGRGGGQLPAAVLFPDINGQAFCFLPLPVRTQLPVHTNAYWELSSNRRDIWRYVQFQFQSN
jgi:hypothetical protein